MAPRRLIPASTVARWEGELRDAADAALEVMHGHVRASFRAHGLAPATALVAASSKRQAAGIATAAGLTVWAAAQWAAAVRSKVAPVTAAIGAEAVQAAKDAVPETATWGMPSSADAIAGALNSQVMAAGNYLGGRLNADVAAAADPVQASEDVFSTASDIVGGQLGASAEAASNAATSDVASYLAGYMGNVYTDATKTWNAVGDDRTRPDHADADGQEVGLNEPFIVGGESLLFPGDPDGSDAQTINCRCWTTTDGIDPGIATYGEPEPDEPGGADQRTVSEENRAGRPTSTQSTPRSYPT